MSPNHSKTTPEPDAGGGENASAPDAIADGKTTGRVKFDDRGNAVWEWSTASGAFGREVSTERLKKLENPELSFADDAPTACDTRANPLGTVKGYNPYDSGKLGKAPAPPRKKDLRKLSEFFKLKKQAADNKDQED